jgi:hypothetical protein
LTRWTADEPAVTAKATTGARRPRHRRCADLCIASDAVHAEAGLAGLRGGAAATPTDDERRWRDLDDRCLERDVATGATARGTVEAVFWSGEGSASTARDR